MLQVSRDTIRRLCESEQLQCDRLGGSRGWFRVHSDSLERYAEENNIRLNWKALEQK